MDMQAAPEGTPVLASEGAVESGREELNKFTLGSSDSLEGKLTYDGHMHVQGRAEGEFRVTGNISVAAGATVKALLEACSLTVEGEVEGTLTARDKLTLGRTAKLNADLHVRRLQIEDGASLTATSGWGILSSRRPAARSPLSSPPDEQFPSGELKAVMLGAHDRLIGQLYIDGDLHVNGTVEGAVEATGYVAIDAMAKVKASITGREVSNRGQVTGSVTARKRLVVTSSGSLIGDARVPRLVVQDGATFNGNVSMGQPAEMASEAAEPADTVPPAAELPPPKARDMAVVPDDGKVRRAVNKRKPKRR